MVDKININNPIDRQIVYEMLGTKVNPNDEVADEDKNDEQSKGA